MKVLPVLRHHTYKRRCLNYDFVLIINCFSTDMILSFITQHWKNMPHDLMEELKNKFIQEYTKGCFYKQMRNQNAKIISNVSEIIIIQAQKDDGIQR